jgi:PAS domain S-box-containing protein
MGPVEKLQAVDAVSPGGDGLISEQAASRLHLAFERSRNPMLMADDQRRWVNGNAAAAELLGITRDAIPWRRMDDFTPPLARPKLDEQWAGFLARGAAEGWYRLWVASQGAAPPFEFSMTANVLSSRHLAVFIQPEEPVEASAELAAPWSLPSEAVPGPGLTRREREVLTLLAAGLRGREVAERLILSPETIKSHVQNALAKLGRRTRAGGVATALITGQIDWESV